MKTEKLLYSRAEAAKMLGICVPTLWKLVSRGEITPRYVGDRPMFALTELQRFAGVSA
jgi:hypothetical protein